MEAAAGLGTQLRDRLASPVRAARLMVRLRRLPREASASAIISLAGERTYRLYAGHRRG